MMRITLMDGSTQEISRENVRGLFAWRAPLTNPRFKSDGVIFHDGSLLPVRGPLANSAGTGSVHERAWLLVCDKHVQIIRGLPAFDDEVSLGIVPEVKRSVATPVVAKAIPMAMAVAPTGPAPSLRSEEEEEAQVLQELEDLLRAA